MKKFLIIILSAFLMFDAFPQSNVNEEVNIRFENRKKEGYFNSIQIATLLGNKELDSRPSYIYNNRIELQKTLSISMTNGHIFNEHLAAGVGVGIEKYSWVVIPVFIDIRYALWDNKLSPFFSFKMGHAFTNSKKKHYDELSLDYEPWYVYNAYVRKHGGLMLSPEMGVKVPISEKIDLLFTTAYRFQIIKIDFDSSYINQDKWKYRLNRLSFGVAMMFR